MIHVRVESDLKTQLEASAKSNGRSLNAEIVHLLTRTLEWLELLEKHKESAVASERDRHLLDIILSLPEHEKEVLYNILNRARSTL